MIMSEKSTLITLDLQEKDSWLENIFMRKTKKPLKQIGLPAAWIAIAKYPKKRKKGQPQEKIETLFSDDNPKSFAKKVNRLLKNFVSVKIVGEIPRVFELIHPDLEKPIVFDHPQLILEFGKNDGDSVFYCRTRPSEKTGDVVKIFNIKTSLVFPNNASDKIREFIKNRGEFPVENVSSDNPARLVLQDWHDKKKIGAHLHGVYLTHCEGDTDYRYISNGFVSSV